MLGNLLSQEGLCHPKQEKANTKHKKRTRLKSKRRWRPGLFRIKLVIFYCVYMRWGDRLYMCVWRETKGQLPMSFSKELPTSYFAFETWSLSLTWGSPSRLSYLANKVLGPMVHLPSSPLLTSACHHTQRP